MSDHPVLFVGYKDQDNLGLGYLASVLDRSGFTSELCDFRAGAEAVLARVRETDPLLIGLSVIFQYFTPDFAQLVDFLRRNGVTCLICAGGHYPSLCPEDVLQGIPGLDCIVRFEGEHTLLELCQCLAEGRDWHSLPSLAYPAGDGVALTPLRPLIPDLDSLPFPRRWNLELSVFGMRGAPVLASRGCPRGCTFCSIRKFYSAPPGKIRRARSVENVVAEIKDLYERHGVRLFMFQDDDFPLLSQKDRDWAYAFVDCLHREGLDDEIMWKISCRSDEIAPDVFRKLQSGGLFAVYLGIESGNSEGLRTLNKQITVAQSRQAVAILNELSITCEFGFMLFDPSSTFESVAENLAFLRETFGDGSSPAVFSRMAPYAGTDIQEELARQGRLQGQGFQLSYSFLDPRLEEWFDYLYAIFQPWAMSADALLTRLRTARLEVAVLRRFWPDQCNWGEYRDAVQQLTAWYNEIYCRIVEDSAIHFMRPNAQSVPALRAIRKAAQEQQHWIENELEVARARSLEGWRVDSDAVPML